VPPQPAALDREGEASSVFCRAAAVLQKRPVGLLDMDAAVLNCFGRVGDFQELAGGFLVISKGRWAAYFITSLHGWGESGRDRVGV
jgi:hypothetical protein